jgi:hypothetical protein
MRSARKGGGTALSMRQSVLFAEAAFEWGSVCAGPFREPLSG